MQTTPLVAGKRAIYVYPSDVTDIPFPQKVVSGVSETPTPFQLVDSSKTFAEVKAGDIVYNVTDLSSATVVRVESPGVIVLNADIFAMAAKVYDIYASSNDTANEGCIIYVGGQGQNEDVKVTTIGGDVVVFHRAPLGNYLPVVVSKVWETGTTAINLLAIW
jgi:hypothetical protein